MCFFSVSGSFDGLCGGFYIIGTIYFSIRNRFVITIYQKWPCWHEDQVCKEICNCQEEHSSLSSLHCHICSGNKNGCISLAYLVWFCFNVLSVLAHEIHQQVFLHHSVQFTSCPLIILFLFSASFFCLFCFCIFLFVVTDSDTLLSVHFWSNDSKELSVMNHLV